MRTCHFPFDRKGGLRFRPQFRASVNARCGPFGNSEQAALADLSLDKTGHLGLPCRLRMWSWCRRLPGYLAVSAARPGLWDRSGGRAGTVRGTASRRMVIAGREDQQASRGTCPAPAWGHDGKPASSRPMAAPVAVGTVFLQMPRNWNTRQQPGSLGADRCTAPRAISSDLEDRRLRQVITSAGPASCVNVWRQRMHCPGHGGSPSSMLHGRRRA
jgi:hypothetical protein